MSHVNVGVEEARASAVSVVLNGSNSKAEETAATAVSRQQPAWLKTGRSWSWLEQGGLTGGEGDRGPEVVRWEAVSEWEWEAALPLGEAGSLWEWVRGVWE